MHNLFRVEDVKGQSLWYDNEGQYKHSEFLLATMMDMGFDERIVGDWFSAVYNVIDFRTLFQEADIPKLINDGFKLYQYQVKHIKDLEWHPVFRKEESSRIELPITILTDKLTGDLT